MIGTASVLLIISFAFGFVSGLIGLCMSRLFAFLEDFAVSILEYLNRKRHIVLRELLDPRHPPTMAALVMNGVGPRQALDTMNFARDNNRMIEISHTVLTKTYSAGTPSAVKLMEEAKIAIENYFYRELYFGA